MATPLDKINRTIDRAMKAGARPEVIQRLVDAKNRLLKLQQFEERRIK